MFYNEIIVFVTDLVIHIFTVNLGLDDVHERINQARAFSQLPPGLAPLRAHIPAEIRQSGR